MARLRLISLRVFLVGENTVFAARSVEMGERMSQELDTLIELVNEIVETYKKELILSSDKYSQCYWKGYLKGLQDAKKELNQ